MVCVRSKTLRLFLIFVVIFVITNTVLYLIVKFGHILHFYKVYKPTDRMVLKRLKLNTFCAIQNITYDQNSPHVLNIMKNLIISRDEFTYCPVYEAASDVCMKMIGEISGLLTDQVKIHIKTNKDNSWKTVIKHYYDLQENPDMYLMETKSTQTFLVVRHPFERFLAVYRNNFEMNPQDNKYKTHFEKELGANWTSQMNTFEKFLRYFVQNSDFDNDLLPIFDQCLPCLIRYRYIIHYDSFIRDSELFLESLYLNKKLAQLFTEEEKDLMFTDTYTAKYYYSPIPIDLMQKLYSIYEDDFLFFDFSPQYFFLLTKK